MSSNPFTRRVKRTGRSFDTEYVRYYEKEVIADADNFDPKNPDQFLVKKVVTEYERLPISEFINQFSPKVGILNELRGVISKKQMDDYVSTHQAKPGYTDLTSIPDTAFEIKKLSETVDRAWESVPEDLKGSLTKEEFLKTLTSEKIKNYISSQIKTEEKKEGE